MNHEFYKDRLSAYFDRELKNEEFVIVDEHVRQCGECQQILAELEKLDAVIDEKSQLADDDYWEKAAQKIEQAIETPVETKILELKTSRYKGLWWKIAGVAASVAFLAFISLYKGDITKEIEQKYMAPPKQIQPEQKIEPETSDEKKDIQPKEKDAAIQSLREQTGEADKFQEERSEEQPVLKPNKAEDLVSSRVKGKTETSKSAEDKETAREPIFQNAPVNVEAPATREISSDESAAVSQSFVSKKESGRQVSASTSPTYEKAREVYKLNNFASESLEQKNELVKWRNTVQTQNTILTKQQNLGLAVADSYVKKSKSDTLKTTKEYEREMYNQLFEAYFNVALITKDSTEKNDALINLNRFANDAKSPYQLDAQMFLNRYDSVKQILDTLKIEK